MCVSNPSALIFGAIAARLTVSPNTLRVHLTRIRAKLDVADRPCDQVLLQAALSQRPL